MRLFRPARDERLLEMLEEAGRNARRATALLRELLADFPERAELSREILLREQDGDRIAHDVIHHIAQAPRRPAFDPRDVYELIRALDDIVDHAEEAADQLGLYGVEAPMEQAQQIAAVLVQCSEQVALGLRGLRNGGDLSQHLVNIHRLENDADRLVRDAVASLFANGIDPMIVIRWKDIFETLEAAVDACETVANVLEGMSLKRANGRH